MQKKHSIMHKVVILGDSKVGKTSVLTRFLFGTFDSDYKATVGIDFMSKDIPLVDSMIRLSMWDTAGQERFKSLIPSYIRDSTVAVVLYDISSRPTFDNVQEWINCIRSERGKDVILVVAGNKSDLTTREVMKAEGEQVAKENEALFYEISAKNGDVASMFVDLATILNKTSKNKDPAEGETYILSVIIKDQEVAKIDDASLAAQTKPEKLTWETVYNRQLKTLKEAQKSVSCLLNTGSHGESLEGLGKLLAEAIKDSEEMNKIFLEKEEN